VAFDLSAALGFVAGTDRLIVVGDLGAIAHAGEEVVRELQVRRQRIPARCPLSLPLDRAIPISRASSGTTADGLA